eukprot:14622669-Alexandrium_andersonii.AAC.1
MSPGRGGFRPAVRSVAPLGIVASAALRGARLPALPCLSPNLRSWPDQTSAIAHGLGTADGVNHARACVDTPM